MTFRNVEYYFIALLRKRDIKHASNEAFIMLLKIIFHKNVNYK